MLKRHGVILTKTLIMLTFIFPLKELPAISIGNLTFSLPSESNYVSKRITNNNKSARLYRVSVNKIDSPGINETISRSVDGELLFAPRQLTLQAGESELFKFYIMDRRMIVNDIIEYRLQKSPLLLIQYKIPLERI